MDPFVYLIISVIIVAILVGIAFLQRKQKNEVDNQPGDVAAGADVHQAARGRAEAQNVGGVRRRGGAPRDRLRNRQDDESDEEQEHEFEHVTLPDGKIGSKKLRKLQEKEEKARRREAEAEEREERKKRQEEQEELRKQKEAQEAAEEAHREAELQAANEQREREEHEEYLRLKEQFTVDEEGLDATEQQHDEQSLLQQFVNYIEEMKVVMLEDLAAHFKIKTQDVIDRIKTLQEEERLSGVLDDRGKFIHITREEYEAVAKFIKQRGRVSISELAEHSNKLINLTPDNQATHARLLAVDGEAVA